MTTSITTSIRRLALRLPFGPAATAAALIAAVIVAFVAGPAGYAPAASAQVLAPPPGATKELIISSSQELKPSGEPYRLPLVGLPKLGDLSIRALVSKASPAGGATGPASSLGGQRARTETVEVHKSQFKPDRDFEV